MKLFTAAFLQDHLASFRAANIPDLAQKRDIITDWIKFLQSGKADISKEENHKSRFLTDVFGKVLGYNYSNVGQWLMQEELKTAVDGTKPDAAFGFFVYEDGGMFNDVRMVVEFKNSGTSLDDVQTNRAVKISPVDQAFLYASKMTGHCHWVAVSNLEEIRFYHYSGQLHYQSYRFTDLAEEDTLREMIYLFQAPHLVHKEVSVTEKLYRKSRSMVVTLPAKKKHIIDEMYDLLQKFNGLHFIDPEYLCTLYPFNILEEKVWHYHRYHLTTLNPEIANFLKGIIVEGDTVSLTPEYAKELEQLGIDRAADKAAMVVRRLNHCLILGISVVEDKDAYLKSKEHVIGFSLHHIDGQIPKYGYYKDIRLKNNVKRCDCIICHYHRLDFIPLIEKVKELSRTGEPAEAGYGHYLLCSYNNREAYDQLKKQERLTVGKDDRLPEYFVSKFNQWNGYQLFGRLLTTKADDIRAEIRSIDLHALISNEIDVYADRVVRDYIIKLKDEQLVTKLKKDVDEILQITKETRELLSKEGAYSGPDHLDRLRHLQFTLYYHTHKNFLMLDAFDDYTEMSGKIFEAYLNSYRTPDFGLKRFDHFQLAEAMVHVKPKTLTALLEKFKKLKSTKKAKAELLTAAQNILSSYFTLHAFGNRKNDLLTAQLLNFRFRKKYAGLLQNVFTLVTRIKCTREQLQPLVAPILAFLEVEDLRETVHIGAIAGFIKKFGDVFTVDQLKTILSIAVKKHTYGTWTYESLISSTAASWAKHYPEHPLNDQRLVQLAILNTSGDHYADFAAIIPIWKICNNPCKTLLAKALDDYLNHSFSESLYVELLHQKIFEPHHGDHLRKLAAWTNAHKAPDDTYEYEGRIFKDHIVYNFSIIVHRFGIDPHSEAIKPLQNLTRYQQWLIDPKNFDYGDFKVAWLLDAYNPYILAGMKGIPQIRTALTNHLSHSYHPVLARIYFKHL